MLLQELLNNYCAAEVGRVALQDHLELTRMTADEVGAYAKFDFSRFEKLKSIRVCYYNIVTLMLGTDLFFRGLLCLILLMC